MIILGAALTLLVGAASLLSAAAKLTYAEPVLETLETVGVGTRMSPTLPWVQFYGALGALLGMVVMQDLPAVGVTALACLSLYYAWGVAFHVRAGRGPRRYAFPAALCVLSAVGSAVMAVTAATAGAAVTF